LWRSILYTYLTRELVRVALTPTTTAAAAAADTDGAQQRSKRNEKPDIVVRFVFGLSRRFKNYAPGGERTLISKRERRKGKMTNQ
jgi:hypothetical protein